MEVLCGFCVVWLLLCGSVALLCGSVVLCGQFGVAVVWYCCVTFVWCGFCAAEWCHCQLCGNYLGHRTLHLTLTSPISLQSDDGDDYHYVLYIFDIGVEYFSRIQKSYDHGGCW